MIEKDTGSHGSACNKVGRGHSYYLWERREERGREKRRSGERRTEEEKGERGRERCSHCIPSKASEALDPDPQALVGTGWAWPPGPVLTPRPSFSPAPGPQGRGDLGI